ncbi:MAG TPA: hypothetical protein VMR19_03095, partial [Candidatus Saccharimonadales bacterium]|nr:hypothetical protein [Candidatus Saccharimonadales bacterium]
LYPKYPTTPKIAITRIIINGAKPLCLTIQYLLSEYEKQYFEAKSYAGHHGLEPFDPITEFD